MKQSNVKKFVYWAKNLRTKKFREALEKYCKGNVLDIGGRDFYAIARKNPKILFKRWTNLEIDENNLLDLKDEKYEEIIEKGNGGDMPFQSGTFDTVINSLVLEHVFEPIKMVSEVARVLKRGGHAIFLIPQTNVLHDIPAHYYNFTKFWIEKAFTESGLEIIELRPLGGRWSSTASHFVHFFFQSFRDKNYSSGEFKRNAFFYILFPFMAIYAILGIAVCMIFSLGDLTEEPNYHLAVARKQ